MAYRGQPVTHLFRLGHVAEKGRLSSYDAISLRYRECSVGNIKQSRDSKPTGLGYVSTAQTNSIAAILDSGIVGNN